MKVTRKNFYEALNFLLVMVGLWASLFLASNFFGSPNDNSLYASNNNSVYKLSNASVYRNEYNFVNLMGETHDSHI